MKITIVDNGTTIRVKQRIGNVPREIKKEIRRKFLGLLRDLVNYAKGTMRDGSIKAAGPRGGDKPVPPPVPYTLTRRHGDGLKKAFTFTMDRDGMGGMLHIGDIQTATGADPRNYGAILRARGAGYQVHKHIFKRSEKSVAWDPLGKAVKAKRKRIYETIREAVRKALTR